MARRRYVSTTISQDTRVNKLAVQYGDFAALLYTWMIPHAADDASLPGDPEELLYQILPGRRDKSPEDVQAALDGMAALGLICGTDDGRITFPTKAFYRYQTYIKDRNKHRDDDPPDDAPKAAQPAAPSQPTPTDTAKQRTSAQNTVSPSLTFSPSFSPSFSDPPSGDTPPIPPTPLRPVAAPPDRPAKEPASFAIFWQAWPKKEARAAALAAWRKVPQDPDTLQAILDAIPRQQAAKDWPRENWRYCPQPATWLNQRRWEDEVPEPVPKGEHDLIGKDKERAEVMRRVAARRGYELVGPDAATHPNGREVSHQPLRVGDGRVPR